MLKINEQLDFRESRLNLQTNRIAKRKWNGICRFKIVEWVDLQKN